MSHTKLCIAVDQIPLNEHTYLERLIEMTVTTLAHMPEAQRMREYARAEVLYTHMNKAGMYDNLTSVDEDLEEACAE